MNSRLTHTLLLLLCLALGACVSETEAPTANTEEGGRLQLSLGNIPSVTTRSTPSELGLPADEDFRLRLTHASGRVVYDGQFRAGEMSVPVGKYTILVEHGDDALIALDAPYLVGRTDGVEVKEKETTSADINVRVGNALVSAQFGADAETQARFARYYSAYAVRVSLGNVSAEISNRMPKRSVYVRAGSTVSLSFVGTLADNGRVVTMPIALPTGVSNTLEAATHLSLVLGLPDPENAAAITVDKAEVDEVTLEEAIPYEWLPAPTVSYEHKRNSAGELVGTNLSVSASFPDLQWTAQIHKGSAAGPVVRTLSGKGALSQVYTQDANWPYLPADTYVATFSYTSQQGTTYRFSKTRTFTVEQPSLTLSLDGYSAHTKYEAGDVDGANACDRLTIDGLTSKWSVAEALLQNANYTKAVTYTFREQTTAVVANSNIIDFPAQTNVPVSGTPYPFTVTANFAGQQLTATKEFRITGLPYSLDTNSHSEWSSSGSVNWSSGDVRLGRLTTGSQSITTNTSVNIPQGTRICADYRVNVHSATIGTTFTITAGGQQMLSITESGGIGNNKDNNHSGTTDPITANSTITSLTCRNSYGAGQTCSHIYALTFKYAR